MSEEIKQGNRVALGIILVIVISSVVGWWLFSDDTNQPTPLMLDLPALPEPKPVVLAPMPEPEPKPVAEPIITPEPETLPEPEPEPIVPAIVLPTLDQSDDFTLSQWFMLSAAPFEPNLEQNNVLRRIAVFIDNLSAGEVTRQNGPFQHLTQEFPVVEVNGSLYLDPQGYERYQGFADIIYRLDELALRDTVLLLEPLMERAYQELGYPAGQFRTQLISAIDLILQSPEYEGPFELHSHSVNYEFADARIESRPDAQKLMIRMGPDNAGKIKSQLRRFKAALNQ